jgi:hypothetical protein
MTIIQKLVSKITNIFKRKKVFKDKDRYVVLKNGVQSFYDIIQQKINDNYEIENKQEAPKEILFKPDYEISLFDFKFVLYAIINPLTSKNIAVVRTYLIKKDINDYLKEEREHIPQLDFNIVTQLINEWAKPSLLALYNWKGNNIPTELNHLIKDFYLSKFIVYLEAITINNE